MLRRKFLQSSLFSSISLSIAASFSILQILGNFLRSHPGEDDSSSPTTYYSNVLSHTELGLHMNYLPTTVVERFKLTL